METITTEGTRLRCMWEVTAGVVPGIAMQQYTKRWGLTSEAFHTELSKANELGEAEGPIHSSFFDYQKQALAYAETLMHPVRLNWVRVDWIWL